MLSTIIDTYNTLPTYVAFLLWFPLPMLISALMLVFILKDDLYSRYGCTRKRAQIAVWVLALMYPLFIVISILATSLTIRDNIIKIWKAFDKWTQNKYSTHQRIRKYRTRSKPLAKQRKECIHMYDQTQHKSRTVCGVGKPSEARKTITTHEVTCSTCLFIMKREKA